LLLPLTATDCRLLNGWMKGTAETCHPEAAVVCVAEYGVKFITSRFARILEVCGESSKGDE